MSFPVLALLLTGALLLGACGGGDDDDADDAGSGGSDAGGTAAVLTIKDFSFSGATEVEKGTSVKVENAGAVRHTVHPDEAGAFQAIELNPGEEGEIPLGTAGTFAYHCNIHSSMKGTFTVS
jgi:plastocyanin